MRLGQTQRVWAPDGSPPVGSMGGAPLKDLGDEAESFSQNVREIWSNMTKNFKNLAVCTSFGAN